MNRIDRMILSVLFTLSLGVLSSCSPNHGFKTINSHSYKLVSAQAEWRLKASPYQQVGFNLKHALSIKFPRRQLLSYISPHGYADYTEESCTYESKISLGSSSSDHVRFNGLPVCAFLQDEETYLLTLHPFIVLNAQNQWVRSREAG